MNFSIAHEVEHALKRGDNSCKRVAMEVLANVVAMEGIENIIAMDVSVDGESNVMSGSGGSTIDGESNVTL